jgi:hypothetical protein
VLEAELGREAFMIHLDDLDTRSPSIIRASFEVASDLYSSGSAVMKGILSVGSWVFDWRPTVCPSSNIFKTITTTSRSSSRVSRMTAGALGHARAPRPFGPGSANRVTA